MKNFIRKNLIKMAISIMVILIISGAGLSYYNAEVMKQALELQKQSSFAQNEVEKVYENVKNMDISSRGYALIREPGYLFYSVENAQQGNKMVFHNLDSIFKAQGFGNPKSYVAVKAGLDRYTDMYAIMVNHLKLGEDSAYVELLKKDIGRYFWETFNPFAQEFYAFEKKIMADSQENYEHATARNTAVQILLIILGLPTLIFVAFRLTKEERSRNTLLLNLQKNNKKYLFDDATEHTEEAALILENSIKNLQKAASFVNEISVGNYEAKWEGLTDEIASANRNNLAGRLILMRDEMKKVKADDEIRMWSTQGLSDFSQIIRQYQHNLEELTLKALNHLIKYTKSLQGSLFMFQEEGSDSYLKLVACYAYDRRKFIEKRINIGDGLLGQAFLESETIVLKKIPNGYLSITSGLGDATPSNLIIVPLKYNDKVVGLVELATFNEYQPYQVSFLEKSGEFIASAINSVQTTERNQLMMEQMRIQTEQLKSQEEELRQNLEELEATQEDMHRKKNLSMQNVL